MAEPGLTIDRVPPRSVAGIGAFRDADGLHAALHAAFGATLPATPGFVLAGRVTFACVAPARFVASGARDADLPARLARLLAGVAAVTDQSDTWESWTLSGAASRDALSRVVPVDLAAQMFRVGDLALTRAGHLDVRLSRTGENSYEVAVTRSFGADLHYQLQQASKGLLS